MAFPGTGYLIANDILTDISYVLVEPVVNTTLGTAVVPGVATCTSPSMVAIYAGAQLIVDTGGAQEVIVTSSVTSTTFTATFANAHASTVQLIGATFPVAENNNPFFTQSEMLSYLSNAQNDYLLRVPMILTTATQNFAPTQRTQSMPADTVQIERVAVNGTALYEQGQASLDLLNYRWVVSNPSLPSTWFEDRLNFMTYGVQPVPLNAFSTEVLYAQRDSTLLALNEGFLLPDPFLTYAKYGTLATAFAKDGEMRDPARAQYCLKRFTLGVQMGRHFYENVMEKQVVANA